MHGYLLLLLRNSAMYESIVVAIGYNNRSVIADMGGPESYIESMKLKLLQSGIDMGRAILSHGEHVYGRICQGHRLCVHSGSDP